MSEAMQRNRPRYGSDEVIFPEMAIQDAGPISRLFRAERAAYVAYFSPFDPGEQAWSERIGAARRDRFWSILHAGRLSGFCMLRGLDDGFLRPSFGVFVAEVEAGNGLGTAALDHCIGWCLASGAASSIMLKVHPDNRAARSIYERRGFAAHGICPSTGQTIMNLDLCEATVRS